MAKTLTESAAWAKLADMWDRATLFTGEALRKPVPHIVPHATAKDAFPCFGLCQSVARLRQSNAVDEVVYEKMWRRLEEYLKANKWNHAYLFPLDESGQKQRADVCRQLSKESEVVVTRC